MNKELVTVCILCVIFLSAVFSINNNHKCMEPSQSSGATGIRVSKNAADYQPKATNSLQGILTPLNQKVQQGIKVINNLLKIFTSSSAVQGNRNVILGQPSFASVASVAAPFDSPAYYQYKVTDTHFRQKIEAARRITQIEKYSSPLSPQKDAFLSHHEIAIQLDYLIWVLLSFEKEGIEAKLAFSSEDLLGPDSTLIESKRVNTPAKRLLDFLKRHENQEYQLQVSNRRDFSQVLWDAIKQ